MMRAPQPTFWVAMPTALLISFSSHAQAQSTIDSQASSPQSNDTIADIVVTAQKRSEPIQSTPVAITALNGASLKDRNTTTIAALSAQVPGLNVSEQIGQARLTLRGVGIDNLSVGAEGSIAFNQDGVFFSRTSAAFASFFDIDRVEVLRGPQGTLYGRNATGGSVNIFTRRPTDTFTGEVEITGGNYGTINSEGFVSGPLGDGVTGRLSFATQRHEGFGHNLVTGSDINDLDSQAVRAQLLFQPSSSLSILVAGDYYQSHDRSNAYHYLGPGGLTAVGAIVTPTSLLIGGFAPTNLRDVASAQDPKADAKFFGARVDVNYDLSDTIIVRSLSAYRGSRYDVKFDPVPLAINLIPLDERENSDQFSQELQLSVISPRNKLVVGLYYLHEDILGTNQGPINLLAVGGLDLFIQGFYAGGRLKTDAAAAYAQDSYNLTSRLHLTLGGRFSWERKGVADQNAVDFSRPYLSSNTPNALLHIANKTFTAFSPKFGIDYQIDKTLLYASFSQGFKSGTFDLGASLPAVRPEKVNAYEAGLKTTLLDGKLRSNFAGFYYDYTNLQVSKVDGNLLVLENAASARIYGLEAELTAKPLHDLTLTANAAWLHARFTKYTTVDQSRPGGDGRTLDPATALPAFNLAGNTLAQSPNYTVSLGAEYAIHLAKTTLTIRGESQWVDRVYFTAFDRQEVSQRPYDLQNAYLNYSTGQWRFSIYVKNIADRTIAAGANVGSVIFGSPILGFLYPPRTYGLTIARSF